MPDEALKKLLYGDIIGSINQNLQIGNITMEDALKWKRYTQRLGEYPYANLDNSGWKTSKDMTGESFMTDVDIMCKEYEDAMAKMNEEQIYPI